MNKNQIGIQSNTLKPSQIRQKVKQNEAQIAKLSGQIVKKRQSMKKISEDMTKIIQKKLIHKQQSKYSHPNFRPKYQNPVLQQLQDHKQSIYTQITKLKYEVMAHTVNEEPQVISEIKKKQSSIINLEKEISELLQQKHIIEDQVHYNKLILQGLHQSQCLREIQENQSQLQAIKKYVKQLDKDIKRMVDQQILMNLYSSELQAEMQLMDEKKQVQQIDMNQFNMLMQDVKDLIQQKRTWDKQYISKRQQLVKHIRSIAQENLRMQKSLRQFDNEQLKKQLQVKKKQLMKNKSTPHISNIKQRQSPLKVKLRMSKQAQLPSLLLTEIPQNKKQKIMKKNDKSKSPKNGNGRTIIIGNWKPQNLIRDDIIQSRNISRAVSMRIKTKDKKIIGIGVTYIDNIGVQVLGRSNIWKIGESSSAEEGQQEFIIDLQDVIAIYYYSQIHNVTDNPSNFSSSIGLKFMSKSSKPVFKIGEFLNQQEIQFINLQNQFIKTVQFALDTNYKSICGIKLLLVPIGEQKTSIEQAEIEQEKIDSIQMLEIKNQQLMPNKWNSTTSQASLTQKAVFIKKNPLYTRRLSQNPQVDHRLMLNRKKKMV